MRRACGHIILALLLLLPGCSRGGKVIPKDKMADIYAEMYLADQWISQNPSMRSMADTSRVYEPVLERYGYTTADYLASAEHYMKDPERYSRILKKSAESMEARLRKLKAEREKADYERSLHHPELWETVDFRGRLLDAASRYAGLQVPETDSLFRITWAPYPSDTLFEGPAFIVDTLQRRGGV